MFLLLLQDSCLLRSNIYGKLQTKILVLYLNFL
jgi:hypothetical protein